MFEAFCVKLSAGQFVEAVAADGFVAVVCAEHHLFLVGREAVGVVGQVAAANTDGVDLRDIFGRGHQGGHRAERLAHHNKTMP